VKQPRTFTQAQEMHRGLLLMLDRGTTLYAVVEHHEPRCRSAMGVFWCGGCDEGPYAQMGAEWPCSTYELVHKRVQP
jgi:hypothetical protein